ncbi:hypothetical protein SAMN04487859_102174 [Roseovarius lutimaris]|uniref:Uncharacterized protein n=1 Tax=Roseovarius lutimaris TaxID=1005928 RepID=A0A1I4YZ17_9RHOB|nr:hypothetical protein SAMN04487859_102174 [Roseovarius lutimaris]
MWYLGVQIARYIDWCDDMQPRLPRWVGFAVFVLGSLALNVLIFVLPEPFGAILLILSIFTIVPAVLFFFRSHSRYWKRKDEQKHDALARTMNVKKMVKRGVRK